VMDRATANRGLWGAQRKQMLVELPVVASRGRRT